MHDATTNAEEDDTPHAGEIVPLTHTLSRRGFAFWWEPERHSYSGR